ncbi:MAG: hypothetical protein ABIR96_12105 [Bdellovibrionota bacterium]
MSISAEKVSTSALEILTESREKITEQVKAEPFKMMGFAFIAGLVVATPQTRALAFRFIARKGITNFF